MADRRRRSVSLNAIGLRWPGSQRTETTRASAATSPDGVRIVSWVVRLVVPRRSARTSIGTSRSVRRVVLWTVTTIAGVFLDLPRYDRRQVDGCWLREAEVSRVLDQLLAMSYDERVANPCIGAERADLVLAGCAILEAIRRAFPCERLRVADRGLREGMLVQLMREDGVWRTEDRGRTTEDA